MQTIESPPLSDDFLALAFMAQYVADLRFVPQWGKWFRWDGARWKDDTTLMAFDLRALWCAGMRSISPNPVPMIRAHPKDWRAPRRSPPLSGSRDPINTSPRRSNAGMPTNFLYPPRQEQPMGIELRTGTIRPNRRDDYCTKITACAADPDMPIPIWTTFLDRVTAQDQELQSYLQRVAGYCLTGCTIEHVLFFLYGTGANGKSIFISTLTTIWGDYAVTAPMETFVETQGERHPTDLAMLRGARLVVAQETEKGRRWAESKIKALTGGDRITARFMRQDFFTYVPQFKLMIAGNHKPSLSSVDEAIRRRFHLIPFTVTIPPAERDRDLFEKLRPEWPGILHWAVEGCLEWQRIGLSPPQAVIEATAEYLAEEDHFDRWVEDCCVTGRHHWGIGDRLWGSWKAWTERNNERSGTRKGFADAMKTHGYAPSMSQRVRGYDGIDLRHSGSDRAV